MLIARNTQSVVTLWILGKAEQNIILLDKTGCIVITEYRHRQHSNLGYISRIMKHQLV